MVGLAGPVLSKGFQSAHHYYKLIKVSANIDLKMLSPAPTHFLLLFNLLSLINMHFTCHWPVKGTGLWHKYCTAEESCIFLLTSHSGYWKLKSEHWRFTLCIDVWPFQFYSFPNPQNFVLANAQSFHVSNLDKLHRNRLLSQFPLVFIEVCCIILSCNPSQRPTLSLSCISRLTSNCSSVLQYACQGGGILFMLSWQRKQFKKERLSVTCLM